MSGLQRIIRQLSLAMETDRPLIRNRLMLEAQAIAQILLDDKERSVSQFTGLLSEYAQQPCSD